MTSPVPDSATPPRSDSSSTPHERFLIGMQLADSFFPSGRYTLSHGLETFVRRGRVDTGEELEAVVRDLVMQAVAKSEAVAVAGAAEAAWRADLEELIDIDHLLFAIRLPRESSLASTRTGSQLVQAGRRLGAGPTFDAFASAVGSGRSPGNHAVAFGALAADWGLTPTEAVLAEMYAYGASLAGAALRLIRIDHLEIQAIIGRLRPELAAIADRAAATDPHEMVSFAPVVEIMQMQHEREHLRLFAS